MNMQLLKPNPGYLISRVLNSDSSEVSNWLHQQNNKCLSRYLLEFGYEGISGDCTLCIRFADRIFIAKTFVILFLVYFSGAVNSI